MVLIIETKYVLCQVPSEIEDTAGNRNIHIEQDKYLAVSVTTIVIDFATMQSISTMRKSGSNKLALSEFSLNVVTNLN